MKKLSDLKKGQTVVTKFSTTPEAGNLNFPSVMHGQHFILKKDPYPKGYEGEVQVSVNWVDEDYCKSRGSSPSGAWSVNDKMIDWEATFLANETPKEKILSMTL